MSNVPFAPNTFTHHCAPLPDNPRTHNTASRTFAHAAAHFYPHSSAPLPMPQRTFTLTPPHLRPLSLAHTTPHLRTFALFSTEGAVLLYEGNGAVLPYEQIVAPMSFECSYGGIREKSIEFF